jgi:hypothetical protein
MTPHTSSAAAGGGNVRHAGDVLGLARELITPPASAAVALATSEAA